MSARQYYNLLKDNSKLKQDKVKGNHKKHTNQTTRSKDEGKILGRSQKKTTHYMEKPINSNAHGLLVERDEARGQELHV